jgi:G3E family GTPase
MRDTKMNQLSEKLPVTVVTGFLGSGKTTLINKILSEDHGRKIAVIVNEFGEVSIDGQLIQKSDEEDLIEFNNGCLCCTVRGDLIETIDKLKKQSELDAILIETTGLADPAPVASSFFLADELSSETKIDSFVAMADAVNLEESLQSNEEAQEQIAFADIILLNKTDLVDEEQLQRVENRIRNLNKAAVIHRTSFSNIGLEKVFGVGAFELDAKLDVDPTFLDDLEHEHDDAVGSFVIRETRPLDINKFMMWITDLLQEQGGELYRSKGIFYARGFKEKVLFQSVRMLTSMEPTDLWESDDKKMTEYVVIGKNLDEEQFRQGFKDCLVDPPN